VAETPFRTGPRGEMTRARPAPAGPEGGRGVEVPEEAARPPEGGAVGAVRPANEAEAVLRKAAENGIFEQRRRGRLGDAAQEAGARDKA
jgi:hypothetical protein